MKKELLKVSQENLSASAEYLVYLDDGVWKIVAKNEVNAEIIKELSKLFIVNADLSALMSTIIVDPVYINLQYPLKIKLKGVQPLSFSVAGNTDLSSNFNLDIIDVKINSEDNIEYTFSNDTSFTFDSIANEAVYTNLSRIEKIAWNGVIQLLQEFCSNNSYTDLHSSILAKVIFIEVIKTSFSLDAEAMYLLSLVSANINSLLKSSLDFDGYQQLAINHMAVKHIFQIQLMNDKAMDCFDQYTNNNIIFNKLKTSLYNIFTKNIKALNYDEVHEFTFKDLMQIIGNNVSFNETNVSNIQQLIKSKLVAYCNHFLNLNLFGMVNEEQEYQLFNLSSAKLSIYNEKRLLNIQYQINQLDNSLDSPIVHFVIADIAILFSSTLLDTIFSSLITHYSGKTIDLKISFLHNEKLQSVLTDFKFAYQVTDRLAKLEESLINNAQFNYVVPSEYLLLNIFYDYHDTIVYLKDKLIHQDIYRYISISSEFAGKSHEQNIFDGALVVDNNKIKMVNLPSNDQANILLQLNNAILDNSVKLKNNINYIVNKYRQTNNNDITFTIDDIVLKDSVLSDQEINQLPSLELMQDQVSLNLAIVESNTIGSYVSSQDRHSSSSLRSSNSSRSRTASGQTNISGIEILEDTTSNQDTISSQDSKRLSNITKKEVEVTKKARKNSIASNKDTKIAKNKNDWLHKITEGIADNNLVSGGDGKAQYIHFARGGSAILSSVLGTALLGYGLLVGATTLFGAVEQQSATKIVLYALSGCVFLVSIAATIQLVTSYVGINKYKNVASIKKTNSIMNTVVFLGAFLDLLIGAILLGKRGSFDSEQSAEIKRIVLIIGILYIILSVLEMAEQSALSVSWGGLFSIINTLLSACILYFELTVGVATLVNLNKADKKRAKHAALTLHPQELQYFFVKNTAKDYHNRMYESLIIQDDRLSSLILPAPIEIEDFAYDTSGDIAKNVSYLTAPSFQWDKFKTHYTTDDDGEPFELNNQELNESPNSLFDNYLLFSINRRDTSSLSSKRTAEMVLPQIPNGQIFDFTTVEDREHIDLYYNNSYFDSINLIYQFDNKKFVAINNKYITPNVTESDDLIDMVLQKGTIKIKGSSVNINLKLSEFNFLDYIDKNANVPELPDGFSAVSEYQDVIHTLYLIDDVGTDIEGDNSSNAKVSINALSIPNEAAKTLVFDFSQERCYLAYHDEKQHIDLVLSYSLKDTPQPRLYVIKQITLPKGTTVINHGRELLMVSGGDVTYNLIPQEEDYESLLGIIVGIDDVINIPVNLKTINLYI